MNFIPKQITKFKHSNFVTYEVFVAPEYLKKDIFYLWNLKSSQKVKSFKYLIIPDTCIDIVLEENDGLLHSPIISKPFNEPTNIDLSGKFSYWGIRFKPGKIMQYLWFDLNTIDNDFKDINLRKKSFNSLEDFLKSFSKYNPNKFNNKFLRFNYNPTELLESNLSSKQKSRLFESLTGFKINSYKKIQKFHASLNDPYLHFYDQSHYIKTFKELTSKSPKKFSEKFSI